MLTFSFPRACALLTCLVPILAASFSLADDGTSKHSLFDGKTLNGWDGDPQHWRVENGAIVGEIPPGQTLRNNTWLVWKGGELADFDLKLQFKLTGAAAANSGIQYRCQVTDVNHVSGYQADLDMGATWLGRIYDEHGRALLVERGTRVWIAPDGTRKSQTLAPTGQYAVLFRENEWNDYRIVAVGDRVKVFINGTLFSALKDEQAGEADLTGQLAFQLHSGPQTRIEFRDIQLETLNSDDGRLGDFRWKVADGDSTSTSGAVPAGAHGEPLNLGFESGTLEGWTATGDAFDRQPVKQDGIASRWAGQVSNKDGDFFVGGFEIVQDRGTGTLTSAPFSVTHPYASFLLNGGDTPATRVDVIQPATGDSPESVLFTAVGNQREQMRRVAVDLRQVQGQQIAVRLVDESNGGWGHLNFDDFRFHDELPPELQSAIAWRSTRNPVLQHLVPNVVETDKAARATETAEQMFVPPGFSVDVIAAEPQLHQPMAFTFDARGRLWVVEGHSYPQKRPAGEGLDRILIFADEDHDGTFESRKVFVEGLNLVSGLEVGHGGVWVGAAPELLFIADRNGDDQPDAEPVILLDGFGFADTHETLNSFMWGPDGWLYGNQGVFNTSMIGKPVATDSQRKYLAAGVWRYHPTKHILEVFAHGGSNQWGLDYDEHGQIFMTHCRSYWGKGGTTHVIQGGHFWNQVNSSYAPFISPVPLPDRPAMKNFLLASARYDHGEGGAGKPGTNDVYGGHSHVGTMLYLGDNWPAEYRNHLFTHNLHGHQMNHQVNLREGGGYNTVHAGTDMFFCADPQYIGVDLQYGPDGAVYISDWYDPRHCHNPNVEHWDRGNGRMYRMKFDAMYRPVAVDYAKASDDQLADAQLHPNEWHGRTARLVLADRAAQSSIAPSAIEQLRLYATNHGDEDRRLRGLWALHSIGKLDRDLAAKLLLDESEYVRAWAVQLAVEALPVEQLPALLLPLAKTEPSLFVRRYLASAVQRAPTDLGWGIARALSSQPENASDRELPQLLWYGVAGLMEQNLEAALALADDTKIDAVRDDIHWYAARLSPAGRDAISNRMASADAVEQLRLLSLFELGVRGMRGLPVPAGWESVSARLYDSPDAATRRAAESLGAAFGDVALFERMRGLLKNAQSPLPARRHALSILTADSSPENLPVLLDLLDVQQLAVQVLQLLVRYDDPRVAESLLSRLPGWQGDESAAALEVLCSRPGWSARLLDEIAAQRIEKARLTAYYARQIYSLGDEPLNERLAKEWGAFGQSSEELKHESRKFVQTFNAAPLWAYEGQQGAMHFKKLCANCHQPANPEERLAPPLAGSGKKGVEYLVENVVDPNAVIGRDFQAWVIATLDGRVYSGLVQGESDTAVTLRTATNTVTIPRDEIEEMKLSPNSFMPTGLLNTLNERERIELFKYLLTQ